MVGSSFHPPTEKGCSKTTDENNKSFLKSREEIHETYEKCQSYCKVKKQDVEHKVSPGVRRTNDEEAANCSLRSALLLGAGFVVKPTLDLLSEWGVKVTIGE